MKHINKIPKFGDQSSDVEILQEALNANGAKLTVDGDFGMKTLDAVAGFQKKNGMQGTGAPGSQTIKLLGLTLEAVRPSGPVLPPDPPQATVKVTRQMVADKIVSIIDTDIKSKMREDKGKNRSDRIDSFNRRVGASLGDPYCASGGWCAIDDACKALGVKNPVPRTAASQDFRRNTFVPAKYLRKEGELGKKGDVATLQVKGDPIHGHHTTLSEDQVSQPFFKTGEYNTDGSGSRDGDGAYYMVRSTEDGCRQNSGKLFASFADIPQWIVDHNSKG